MAAERAATEHELLDAALARLRDRPFHFRARIVARQKAERAQGRSPEPDVEIEVTPPKAKKSVRLLVETKRTHLSYALVDGVVGHFAKAKRPWILCAPYVAPPMANYLAERGVNFMDTLGNVHLDVPGQLLLHHVESRAAATRQPAEQALRPPAYKVILAILARPEILEEPIRKIEIEAGVSKSTVSNQLHRLEREGVLAPVKGHYRLVRARALFEKWITGYADVLRPALLLGRYDSPFKAPDEREERLAHELNASGKGQHRPAWRWGGASAGWRLVKHYRAPTTTLHVDVAPTEALRRVRALPSRTGAIELLRIPNALALGGPAEQQLRVVHPLLIYAEMMTSSDERTRESAAELQERHFTRFQ